MFESVGWGEILILALAGLFILGPERLPGAAAWLGQSLRKVREFASGARDQLRSELGPEYDELRKPLQDLQQLRNFDPKRAVTKHLLDDDWSNPLAEIRKDLDGKPLAEPKPNGYPITPAPAAGSESARPLTAGERPPFDPDAT